jgi:nicotinamide mononucleotide transporter
MLKGWNYFERSWVIFFSALGLFLTLFYHDTLLNFAVLFTGILCVIFAAKGSLFNYVFGMANTIAYAFVAYRNGLFGELGLYLLFFLPMNIIGFAMWKNKMNTAFVQMRGLKISCTLLVCAVCALLTAGLGIILSHVKGQNSPYVDAASTVISIVATFLMVLRYKEQWLLYIVLNIVTTALWIIRAANGSEEGRMMIAMWIAFLINAVYGYYNWSRGARMVQETADA